MSNIFGLINASGDMVDSEKKEGVTSGQWDFDDFTIPDNINIITLKEEDGCVYDEDGPPINDILGIISTSQNIEKDLDGYMKNWEQQFGCADGYCDTNDKVSIHIHKSGDSMRDNNLTRVIDEPFLVFAQSGTMMHINFENLPEKNQRGESIKFIHPVRAKFDSQNPLFYYNSPLTITLSDLVDFILKQLGGGTFVLWACRQSYERLLARKTNKGGAKNRRKRKSRRKRKTGGRKKQKGGEGNWVKKIDIKEDKCALCWEPLNSKIVYQFDCGHQFHSDCINLYCEAKDPDDVVDGNLTCPICRKANTPDENDCISVWAYKEDVLDPSSDVIVNKSLYVGGKRKRRKRKTHKRKKTRRKRKSRRRRKKRRTRNKK